MQYTPMEQECLDLMNRTNFKAPSKDEIVSLVSKLHQMRPEVAQEIIKQFPEFVSLIKTSMTEYRGMLESIIKSDDNTTDHVYETIDHALNNSGESQSSFKEMASTVLADLSKSLDNPDLSTEDRKDILDREERILRMASEKDTENRQHEAKMVETAERTASEKRKFNWEIVKTASCFVIGGILIGAAVFTGGDIKLKLPKK